MERLVEQLERRIDELARWLEVEHGPPADVRIIRQHTPDAKRTDFEEGDAPLLDPGGAWREPLNTTVWLRFQLTRPDRWPVEDTALAAQRFGTYPVETLTRIGLGLQRMQGMLYVDGQAYHGIDQYHRLIYLPAGPHYQFAASVWTGFAALDWQPNPVFRLVRTDPAALQLYHDVRVLVDALRALPLVHTARPALERLAESALVEIDWRSPGSAAFRASLARAHDLLAEGLAQLTAAEYEPRIVAVGHAHIDCAWLWPIAQTREKAGRTWSTALRLMERYPEYRFLASTPLQYEMVKQDFPETFAAIRERVREGRWETVGGMWVEADCNLPDGESLARQMLLGTRYFEREFGQPTTVVWLPDTFGFSWAVPTLMAAAGLPYFVTHKLSWSQTNRIPHDTFRWRGPDGRDVLAHFLCTPSLSPGEKTTYNGTLLPSVALGAWARYQDRLLHNTVLSAFGYGDGGGGPTLDMIEAGRRLNSLPGFPRVEMGRADAFFANLEAELANTADVPVWDGELYLEYHRGTYTGQARQKLRNALSQRLYHAAELYAAMARSLLGTPYPHVRLEEGWRLLLTNQFHDILPGSAISSVYVDAQADFEALSAIGQSVLDEALTAVAGATNLNDEALIVFNPAPFPSADYIEVPSGIPIAGQETADGGRLVWCADVPPNGYRAMRLRGTASPPLPGPLRISQREIDTPFWHMELDTHGRITWLQDKRINREVVPRGALGNRLVVFEDKPLDYDAWDIDAFYVAKSIEIDQLDSARILESGPERAILELRWRIADRSRIVQRLCVYARSPRIDFITDVDWQERQALLRVAFATAIRNRRATYEIQFGTIDRPTHRNTSWEEAAFEVPAQRWVDLSDATSGVALLADCKHGYSAQADTLWLSLLKGAVDPDPEADRGEHHFTYSLLPHAAGLEEVRRAAYGLTRPLLWRREPPHTGRLPTSYSLASTDTPG
ncbi:MAG TPA: glycoside hydrolase family 38 C-terminal domain-containing protein, partial [Chloroflexota bacterium]|nr:glycoside hydrolase family 38 C-terminal domain-containing protein [Chloroflexota bacterium]